MGAENLTPTGIRSPDLPARGKSLYRLSYPSPYINNNGKIKSIPTLYCINPLNTELNPICHLMALLGAHPVLHVSRIRVNVLYIRTQYVEDFLKSLSGNVKHLQQDYHIQHNKMFSFHIEEIQLYSIL
jgi:hypothetical protein